MDPLSLAASVAGLLQIAITVTDVLIEFAGDIKDAPTEVEHLQLQSESLCGILEELRSTLLNEGIKGSSKNSNARFQGSNLANLGRAAEHCGQILQQIDSSIRDLGAGQPPTNKSRLLRVLWHFKKSSIIKLSKKLSEHISLFSLALCVHTANSNVRIEDAVERIERTGNSLYDNVETLDLRYQGTQSLLEQLGQARSESEDSNLEPEHVQLIREIHSHLQITYPQDNAQQKLLPASAQLPTEPPPSSTPSQVGTSHTPLPYPGTMDPSRYASEYYNAHIQASSTRGVVYNSAGVKGNFEYYSTLVDIGGLTYPKETAYEAPLLSISFGNSRTRGCRKCKSELPESTRVCFKCKAEKAPLGSGELLVGSAAAFKTVSKICKARGVGLRVSYCFPSWCCDKAFAVSLVVEFGGFGSFSIIPGLRVYNIVSQDSPIIDCVDRGDLKGMINLFRAGRASIYDSTNDGTTLIHRAAEHGHLKMMYLLEKEGLDVNALDANQDTPMKNWIFKSNYSDASQVMGLLMANGADPAIPDYYGGTALHSLALMASRPEQPDIVPIIGPMFQQDEFPLDVNAIDGTGRTALHIAAIGGNDNVVDLILNRGADVDIVDIHGWGALHYSIFGGRKKNIIRHLEAKPDLGAMARSRNGSANPDEKKATLTDLAVETDHLEEWQEALKATGHEPRRHKISGWLKEYLKSVADRDVAPHVVWAIEHCNCEKHHQLREMNTTSSDNTSSSGSSNSSGSDSDDYFDASESAFEEDDSGEEKLPKVQTRTKKRRRSSQQKEGKGVRSFFELDTGDWS